MDALSISQVLAQSLPFFQRASLPDLACPTLCSVCVRAYVLP